MCEGMAYMNYVLKENVYLVKGSAKSCMYDFNTGKLYSVNENLAKELEKINDGLVKTEFITPDLKPIIEKFVNLGLVDISEYPKPHDIQEIKSVNTTCKMAWIEITSVCNLRCVHCYNESDATNINIMSFNDYKLAIDNVINIGIRKIQIIGGEPFTHKKELKKMLNYTIGKVDYIEIFTNRTLIDDDWYKYIAINNIHVALSLYSYDKQMHDKVTGKVGSWEKTHRTIEMLKQYKIPYRVCNVLMADIDIGEKNTDCYTLSEEKDVVRMSGRANFKLLSKELIRKKLITQNTFRHHLKKEFCKRLISGHNCYKDRIYISANLEVFPCVMERRIKHCTLGQSKHIILNDNIRNMTKDKIDDCKKCEYRYCCFDCRPNSLSGKLYEKPWYCTYDPITGKWCDENIFIQKLLDKWQ